MEIRNKIKAVFIDLDGTLLHGIDTITPRTVEALKRIQEAGILPIITTGRPAYEADFAVRATGADTYMIAMNGLQIYEDYRCRRLLYEAFMDRETSKTVVDFLIQHDLFFEAYIGDRAYCQKNVKPLIYNCGMTEEMSRFFLSTMTEVEDINKYTEEKDLHINKLFFSEEDTTKIPALKEKINKIKGIRAVSSSEHYVEILPEGADKKSAVVTVREDLGLSYEEIMVIGDSQNDVGMFDEAFTCVAMGNAFPELKAKANYITLSNKEDGVAHILEKLLLGESGPRITGHIENIKAEEIEASLLGSTRQYLTGDLKLPQQLDYVKDEQIETGISAYPHYKWEQPHYHTVANEYCYMIEGETKYIDLNENKEYHFKKGDFYVLRQGTKYLQKCKAGCKLFFIKTPGLNDKVKLDTDEKMLKWAKDWETKWDV